MARARNVSTLGAQYRVASDHRKAT